MKDKFKYSVIQIASQLASEVSGTSDPIHPNDRKLLQDWLRRRLENWEDSMIPNLKSFDDAAKKMAEEALRLSELKD